MSSQGDQWPLSEKRMSGEAVQDVWDDPNQKPLIRFEGVTKRFGDFTAIDNLSLDIYASEFFALLGPSGCGKTTLMRLLAGLDDLTAGRILLDGQDLSGMPPNTRPVNMMFQSYALFPHMTVERNIGFGLKQEQVGKSEIKQRVDELLSLVQLEGFAHRKPHQLSGGQKQRVALARSLAKKPKVLLLDEPLAALDKKLREQTQFELANLQDRLGLTFLIVTHDQEEAMTMASRIAVIRDGRVVQVDTPARVYEHPNCSYVAGFVGNVNLFDVRVTEVDGTRCTVTWTVNDDPIYVHTSGNEWAKGDSVQLVLRPEKVAISKDKPPAANGLNQVRGIVEEISYTGSSSTFHVRLGDGSLVSAEEANRVLLNHREITWDDEVWLCWRADASVLVGN